MSPLPDPVCPLRRHSAVNDATNLRTTLANVRDNFQDMRDAMTQLGACTRVLPGGQTPIELITSLGASFRSGGARAVQSSIKSQMVRSRPRHSHPIPPLPSRSRLPPARSKTPSASYRVATSYFLSHPTYHLSHPTYRVATPRLSPGDPPHAVDAWHDERPLGGLGDRPRSRVQRHRGPRHRHEPAPRPPAGSADGVTIYLSPPLALILPPLPGIHHPCAAD